MTVALWVSKTLQGSGRAYSALFYCYNILFVEVSNNGIAKFEMYVFHGLNIN